VFLGAFGVHKFILGYTKPAIVMLVVSLVGGVVTCGLASFVMGAIGLIEGIIYLTKTTAAFQAEYLDAEKDLF
jgi:TM2 domain-containing membrane protein YozV